jgi:hypothetical protein
LRDITTVHGNDQANWRAALARLLLTSKAARHGVLVVEESPHTRDIIDVLLALRPWIQPTVIVLSADAAPLLGLGAIRGSTRGGGQLRAGDVRGGCPQRCSWWCRTWWG